MNSRKFLAAPKATFVDIPELSGSEEESNPPPRSSVNFVESQIEARNFPYMVWTYTDHKVQQEMVCVSVPTITGSRDIKFVISDDGMQLSVEFVWPSVLLDPVEFFMNVVEDDGSLISMRHPKVYSYQNRLVDMDLSGKSKPKSSLIITLPAKSAT